MSPQQVLDTVQSLYETHKATTYPRSDCGFLPVSMREEIPQVLAAIVKTDPSLTALITTLNPRFESRIWNDKKITAHHGIIPTKHACDLSKMNDVERRVYELIRRHYLAQFLPLFESDVTRIDLSIGGQLFRTTGRVVVVPGWKVLFTSVADDKASDPDEEDKTLPALNKGDACTVAASKVKSLKTKAPLHFTFDTLIAAMMNAASYVTDLQLKKVLKENAGLGTEATRAGIIDTLLKRGYVVIKGRYLRATEIAMDLMDALPPPLKEPGMTALWEQALDEVAAGRMRLEDFMTRQTGWTRQLVTQGLTQNMEIRLPPTPACPLCSGQTRLRRGEKGAFYSCEKYPTCKGVVNIPDQMKKKTAKSKSRKPKQN
ncbi:DNA topoisomerase [Erwinia rhapontici]